MPIERIALVHERFTEVAGSEQVVEQLAVQWPRAEVHASIARPAGVPKGIGRSPNTTWLNRPYRMLREKSHAPLMPFMPRAFRKLDLGDVDAVIVSHHAFATQAVFATEAPVIAYVHSPARWAWDPSLRAGEGGGVAGAAILTGLAAIARTCETVAAKRLRAVIANSNAVEDRIAEWWGRDDTHVVHPPVDTDAFTPDPSVGREDFFLLAGRLVPYKRPDLAIRAATAAGMPLVVAGDGRAMKVCRDLAGPRVTFLGRVSHDELLSLHRRAKALLMPGVEDFGIVPVEAMATGTPVIALGDGGAIDTVLPGVTGCHVAPGTDDQVVDGFVEAMRSFDPDQFDRREIRAWSEGFSRSSFRKKMQEVLDDTV